MGGLGPAIAAADAKKDHEEIEALKFVALVLEDPETRIAVGLEIVRLEKEKKHTGDLIEIAKNPEFATAVRREAFSAALEITRSEYKGREFKFGLLSILGRATDKSLMGEFRTIAWNVITELKEELIKVLKLNKDYSTLIQLSEDKDTPEELRSIARENIEAVVRYAIDFEVEHHSYGSEDIFTRITTDERLPRELRLEAGRNAIRIIEDFSIEHAAFGSYNSIVAFALRKELLPEIREAAETSTRKVVLKIAETLAKKEEYGKLVKMLLDPRIKSTVIRELQPFAVALAEKCNYRNLITKYVEVLRSLGKSTQQQTTRTRPLLAK